MSISINIPISEIINRQIFSAVQQELSDDLAQAAFLYVQANPNKGKSEYAKAKIQRQLEAKCDRKIKSAKTIEQKRYWAEIKRLYKKGTRKEGSLKGFGKG